MTSNPILWGEGLFLRPQHFQQQLLSFDASVAQSLRLGRGHPWGVRQVRIDADALRSGTLRIDSLELFFRDGTHVNSPAENPLPLTRNLSEIGEVATRTVVYACLPAINPYGGNSSENGRQSTDGSTRPTRYISSTNSVRDLFTDALEAEVTTLQANVRLMVEEENRDGHLCVAIGGIEKNANGTWELTSHFIPPLVDIGANLHLSMLLRRLLDILQVKSRALAARHREKVKSVVEYGTSDIASFWLLHTVNRNFPLLNHYLASETHPEDLYTLLAQLSGELLTFSSELTLTDIPTYDHEDLTSVFSRLDKLIRELLETVVSNRYAVIPLVNTKPSFFVGRLESERLVENVDYYLSVSSDLPSTKVLDMVPLKLKAGSPDDVEKILNSALPGVRLVHAAQTPSALPVRVGNHYFVLEPQGQIFERMRSSRSICIYVPQTLLELKLELFAVFH